MCSQTIVKGKILDNQGNPISSTTLSITEKATDNIIAYAISDAKGFYSISFSSSHEIDIQIKCMGYESIIESIANVSQTKNYSLKEKAFELKEVIVKSSSITKIGDTINYSVRSFSKDQDRSIADVLKRMPGIEVLSDGKVLYQGKPINKYYIEGLDLLEGRYNLANENLPHKEVTQVQILENHQPIKALDSLKFSDEAALNIKLKNAYTFTGQAKLGAGISPLLWDINATPMLFTKKRQLLTTYQANNTGENVASQLKKFTFEDLLDLFENNSEKKDWLGIQPLLSPTFSEKRWLNNNIHLLSGNYLQKIKEYELRVNVSYLNDYKQQRGFTNTQFITPSETVNLSEEKHNQLYYNSLQTNFIIQKNIGRNYFKNSLEFNGFWDSQSGKINSNNELLKQELYNEFFRFSNNLKSIFPLGKQMITLNSYLGFNKTPQELSINPGQFENLLNENITFEVTQRVDLKTFYTNNSIGFTKAIQRFTFEPKIGVQLETQTLQSDIFTSDGNLNNEFTNNLDWFRSKLFLDLQTQFKRAKWRVELSTPLNFHHYKINDAPLHESENVAKITFEPKLLVIYDINSFWKLNSSAGLSNQFGTINQLHYAYILKNYRNIQRTNSPLPETKNQNYSIGIGYRNPVKSFFWTLNYAITKGENNLLYKTLVSPNGATELAALEQNNKRTNQNFSSRANKYISEIKSNITLSTSLQFQDFKQVVNNNLADISNQNLNFGSKITTDINDWLNVEVQSNWTFSKNKTQAQHNPTIKQQNNLLDLNFHLTDNQYFALKSEYISNNLFSEKTKNLFTDFLYRYTIKKKKIDIELQLSNLFNTKNFRTVNISDFSYVETNFDLRPRQALFKVRFAL